MFRMRVVRALWWVVLVGVFLVPYWHPRGWSFGASSCALAALCAVRWRARGLARAGLGLRGRDLVATLALAGGLWALFEFVVVPGIAEQAGLVRRGVSVRRAVAFPFQALNEEMVLGYLLLVALVRWTRRPVATAVTVALVFAVLHHLLYRYGELGMDLAPATLLALLAVGVVRNAAILLANHVGYAWALHAAWNLVMFSGRWLEESTGRPLKEPEVLDAFLDTPWVIVPACAAAVILLAALRRSR